MGNTLCRVEPPNFFGFQPVAMSGYNEQERFGSQRGGSNPDLLNIEAKVISLDDTGAYMVGVNLYEKSDLSESANSPYSDIVYLTSYY